MELNAIRNLTIRATTEGVDQARVSLERLAGGQAQVAVTSERTTAASLSMERQLQRLQMSVDPAYRSVSLLTKAERELQVAQEQGLITLARQNELLGLSKAKYEETAAASGGLMARLEGFKSLAAGAGIFALFEAGMKIHEVIDSVVQSSAGLVHAADTIGITTKNLQELQFAGSQFHLSTETMDTALEKFSKNLGIAATGSGELYKILKANHVVLSGDVKTDFINYANLIQNTTNAEEKNLLATTAFGKNAAELGGLFDHGAAGIANFAGQAERMGAVASDDSLRRVDELSKKWAAFGTALGVTFKGAIVEAVLAFADLQDRVTGFLDFLTHFGTGDARAQAIRDALMGVNGQPPTGRVASGIGFDASAGPMLTPAQLERVKATAALRSALGTGVPGASAGPGGVGTMVPGSFGSHWGDTPTVIPSTPSPPNALDQALKAADKQNVALNAQIHAFGMAAGAAAELTKREELLAVATENHIKLSPADITAIDRTAAAYGKETDQLRHLNDVQQAQQFLAQSIFDTMKGLVDHTESAAQAFGHLAEKIAEAVIQAEFLGTGPFAGILGTSTAAGGGGGLITAGIKAAMGFFHIAHSGGVLGADSLPGRYVHPAYFDNAPRFAMGGLAGIGPDEVPIIAHLGEEILRRDDPRHRLNQGSMPISMSGAQIIIQGDASENTVGLIKEALSAHEKKVGAFVRDAVLQNNRGNARRQMTHG